MADVYGRLTGRAGVCLATLGPGATNLITGVADANMDQPPWWPFPARPPPRGCTRRATRCWTWSTCSRPISKYHTQIVDPETIPEVVRKAFKQAQTEKPGVGFIDFPENMAQMRVDGKVPLRCSGRSSRCLRRRSIQQAADIISPPATR